MMPYERGYRDALLTFAARVDVWAGHSVDAAYTAAETGREADASHYTGEADALERAAATARTMAGAPPADPEVTP